MAAICVATYHSSSAAHSSSESASSTTTTTSTTTSSSSPTPTEESPLRMFLNWLSKPFSECTTKPASPVKTLLRPLSGARRTVVLDLDETLIRTSYQPIPNPDFVVLVDDERAYVKKRPGVERFLAALKEKGFEIVLWTASEPQYADPVVDFVDVNRVISTRLYRDSCTFIDGLYIKDLSLLGRDLNDVIIVDNSQASFTLQLQNGYAIGSYLGSLEDTELNQLLPFLTLITRCRTPVPQMLQTYLSARSYNTKKGAYLKGRMPL
ncbi:carboxy-terminal domain RNA polymerase II polypeptide A small phosphatase 1 [Pelomyxa schiedti]|nr:carboxy-terminal domain RNA polymerase II polypeptide A small phosphatase 1 [Pelomyxa schiedti]